MDSDTFTSMDTSESNLAIITNKARFMRFLKIYRKTILFFMTLLIFMPIALVGENNAYKSFYVFLVTATIFTGGFLHPGVSSLVPITLFTIMGAFNWRLIHTINVSNSVLNCLGVMAIILAVEHSNIHKRVAIKILLIFGCSHFRLSFLLFITTSVLSMWFSNCLACGLMMPLVKAVLKELEKMGILETNEIIAKVTADSIDNEKYIPRPSDFTMFYLIGIAYSSTIGGMATYIGSETNHLFINYCAAIFPDGPQLESPHFLLLTLPGVILMEIFLYLWLNFYFLGMLRVQNYTALQTSLTSDEEQFISVLLTGQYQQMGKIKFSEKVVGATVVLAAVLQATILSTTFECSGDKFSTRCNMNTSVPCIICILILLVTPSDLDCLKFLGRQSDNFEPLPTSPSRGCLTWAMVKNNIDWSVIFVTAIILILQYCLNIRVGFIFVPVSFLTFVLSQSVTSKCNFSLLQASANIAFESLEHSKMTEEFEIFLSVFSNCPAPVQTCTVIVVCKILTEFANNATVARCMLAHIANVGVKSKGSPLYFMLSATLSTSLPFHLITGTPSYAMISAYVHIPPRKLMVAGIGPSLLAILLNLFTVCVWSKVIWPDIDTYSSSKHNITHAVAYMG